jgi:hypothetical protein
MVNQSWGSRLVLQNVNMSLDQCVVAFFRILLVAGMLAGSLHLSGCRQRQPQALHHGQSVKGEPSANASSAANVTVAFSKMALIKIELEKSAIQMLENGKGGDIDVVLYRKLHEDAVGKLRNLLHSIEDMKLDTDESRSLVTKFEQDNKLYSDLTQQHSSLISNSRQSSDLGLASYPYKEFLLQEENEVLQKIFTID